MPFARTHSTLADGTFSATGAIAWDANQTPSGADVGGIPYCPTATTETTSAKFIFNDTTLVLAMGTVTAAPGAISITQTRNAAGTTFDGVIKAVITDTASAAASLAVQILGGASGTTNLFQITKGGVVYSNGIPAFQGSGSTTYLNNGSLTTTNGWALIGVGLFSQRSDGGVNWSSTTSPDGTADTGLSRTAAGEIAFGNGTPANVSGTCRAAAYKVGATAGADFGPGLPTSITVVKGIITAIS